MGIKRYARYRALFLFYVNTGGATRRRAIFRHLCAPKCADRCIYADDAYLYQRGRARFPPPPHLAHISALSGGLFSCIGFQARKPVAHRASISTSLQHDAWSGTGKTPPAQMRQERADDAARRAIAAATVSRRSRPRIKCHASH